MSDQGGGLGNAGTLTALNAELNRQQSGLHTLLSRVNTLVAVLLPVLVAAFSFTAATDGSSGWKTVAWVAYSLAVLVLLPALVFDARDVSPNPISLVNNHAGGSEESLYQVMLPLKTRSIERTVAILRWKSRLSVLGVLSVAAGASATVLHLLMTGAPGAD